MNTLQIANIALSMVEQASGLSYSASGRIAEALPPVFGRDAQTHRAGRRFHPMNTLQIANIALSMVCLVITTVLAWVMIYRTNKTEVTFTGTPVDKKEFEKHQRENKEEHDRFFTKLDAMQAEFKTDREKLHFRINPIEGDICALREASETNTTRLVQMDAKIDRLIERTK